MNTPLVTVRFYERSSERSGWETRGREDALRQWHHVPCVGDRVDLDALPTPEVDEGVSIGVPHGGAHGKVFEVIWTETHVKVLLTW